MGISLNLTGENHLSRNSACNFGGDTLTGYVKNPRDPHNLITGIKVILIPYVPNQDLEKTQYYEKMEFTETFVPSKEGINVTYPDLVPEYSYLVSIAFNTEVKGFSNNIVEIFCYAVRQLDTEQKLYIEGRI